MIFMIRVRTRLIHVRFSRKKSGNNFEKNFSGFQTKFFHGVRLQANPQVRKNRKTQKCSGII